MVAWPLILGIISHTGLFRFYILLISIITLGKKVELHRVTLPCKAFEIPSSTDRYFHLDKITLSERSWRWRGKRKKKQGSLSRS